MFAIFWLTFNVIGSFLSDLLTMGIDAFTAMCDLSLIHISTEKELAYYVKDGVLAPVSGDYVFSELVNPASVSYTHLMCIRDRPYAGFNGRLTRHSKCWKQSQRKQGLII